jgi:hypothetical protein
MACYNKDIFYSVLTLVEWCTDFSSAHQGNTLLINYEGSDQQEPPLTCDTITHENNFALNILV